MAKILAVGIATIDIINHVSVYPLEDDEVRALSQQQSRGGNATNTLAVLSQFGHDCHWAGVLINEPDALIVERDLQHYRIDYSHCLRLEQGKMPTSYITLSESSGSRSIVHHRDCPEFDFAHFKQIDLSQFDWVHFEGRNLAELEKMLRWLRQQYPQLPCSLEVEKPRQGIEALFDLPDVLMFSRQYAEAKGHASASSLLQHIDINAFATCTWGAAGAWALTENEILHCPAFPPPQVIDTLGAGDTFNAGLISALLSDNHPRQALESACQLAGRKCGQIGFEQLNQQA
jgi:ketohexokinase